LGLVLTSIAGSAGGFTLINSLPVRSNDADFFAADASKLYRQSNETIFLFLIIASGGILVHHDNVGVMCAARPGKLRENPFDGMQQAKQVKKGDIFLCYLTGVQRWVGALEIAGISTDTRSIWKEEDFPVRFDVTPLVLLEPVAGELLFAFVLLTRSGAPGGIRTPGLLVRSQIRGATPPYSSLLQPKESTK
jgi:hypothetical protein